MTLNHSLPQEFRKLPAPKRREVLRRHLNLSEDDLNIISGRVDLSDLADAMIEFSIGTFPVPFGLATGFLIDDAEWVVPMVTEEPSVIAAATYAAAIVKRGGGFRTWSDDPVITAQVFLKNPSPGADEKIYAIEEEIKSAVDELIPNMTARGGGYRGLRLEHIGAANTLCVSIDLDVRDAMGANCANTVAESLKERLGAVSGGEVLMAILTNDAAGRKAGASFEVPVRFFSRNKSSGREICAKIVEASNLAHLYPARAVTHNKGIMNGITALALATGNDTRAIEAGAHFYAQRSGSYRALTSFELAGDTLQGKIELPLTMGTVGGSVGLWPASRLSLKLLGNPDARKLNQVAAAAGLAQNLAAVFALVSDGIQRGHMKLHAARIAYQAGARGPDIRPLAQKLWEESAMNTEKAKAIYQKRAGKSSE